MDGPLASERDDRWHVTEVGSLVIEAVQKSDEANYVCRAENMVGSRDSDSIRLNVHGKHAFFCLLRIIRYVCNLGCFNSKILDTSFFQSDLNLTTSKNKL